MRDLRFAIVAPAIVLAGDLVAEGQVYRDHVENAARVVSVQQQIDPDLPVGFLRGAATR